MQAKIIFLDDIFSKAFRSKLTQQELLWDDNWVESVVKALAKAKDSVGFEFQVVQSGEVENCAGLVAAEQPDAVICDLFWPEQAQARFGERGRGADIGLQALTELRKASATLPVVAYTVNPDASLRARALDHGATFFLEKVPMALPEVQSPLAHVLAHLLTNAARS